jgi:hypothetical protein
MIKKDLYRYTGRNGIITSLVHLDDIKYYPMYRLIADEGKLLTDGTLKYTSIDIFVEDLDKWTEIDNIGQD